MTTAGLRNAVGGLLLGMLLLLSLYLLGGWGTSDVGIFLRWMELTHEHGLVGGYALSIENYPRGIREGMMPLHGGGEYPPLSYAVLFLARRIGGMLGLSPFVSFKLLLFCYFCAAVALFLWFCRDMLLTAGFAAAILLDCVALGYVDVFVVPWLIGAFWMLRLGRPLLGVALVLMAVLFKWQPLAILPFVLIQALGITGFGGILSALRARSTWQVAALGLGMLGVLVLVFGASPFIGLGYALSNPYLSANAMNLPWLLVFVFRLLLEPGFTLGSEMGYATPPALVFLFLPVKLVFWAVFAAVLLRALHGEKTVRNCLLLSILGFTTYFMLNAGAHENHLFVPVVLAFILLAMDHSEGNRLIALLLAAMLNLNIFFFFGITGTPLRRAVQGIDISLLFALVFAAAWTLLFAYVWRETSTVPASLRAGPRARDNGRNLLSAH